MNRRGPFDPTQFLDAGAEYVMHKSREHYSVVAGKVGRFFGRRQTYHVDRLQRTLGLRSKLPDNAVPRTKVLKSYDVHSGHINRFGL